MDWRGMYITNTCVNHACIRISRYVLHI
jgi:hypothetical protein